MHRTVVLAFSGGLDTSVCVKWLQEKYDADVVTMTLDLGQRDDIREVERQSRLLGAVGHHSLDSKD